MSSTMPNESRGVGSTDPRKPCPKEIVIVASACDRFDDFVAAGGRGEVGLHFCVDGRSALRMARRFRADIWLVCPDLPDMSGLDLLEMLLPAVSQSGVNPLLGGARLSLEHLGEGPRSGVFIVADGYSFDDEQRALRAGAAGYLAGPVSMERLREARSGQTRRPVHPVSTTPQAR